MSTQKQRSRLNVRRTRLINGAACLLTCCYLAAISLTIRSDADFQVYYEAATVLRAGGDPYIVPAYVYGPIFAWLLQPATSLSLGQAHGLWLLIQAASLLGVVWLSIYHSGAEGARRYWGIVMLCTILAVPTYIDLLLGQAGSLMALLTIAGYSPIRRCTRWAGWSLGLSIVLKIYPALLVLAYLRRRQWCQASTIATSTVVLIMLTALVCGPGILLDFARKLTQESAYPYTAEHNISLFGFWLRLFTDNPFVRPLAVLPWAAYAAIALSVVGLLGTCLWFGQQANDTADRVQFSMWLCTLLLLFPATGIYNLTLLLFPLLVCVRVYEERGFPFVRWGLLIIVGLLYIPPLSSFSTVASMQTGYGVVLYFTPTCYSVLALFGLLVATLVRLRQLASRGEQKGPL